jgi:hypothetical protein
MSGLEIFIFTIALLIVVGVLALVVWAGIKILTTLLSKTNRIRVGVMFGIAAACSSHSNPLYALIGLIIIMVLFIDAVKEIDRPKIPPSLSIDFE